MKTLILILFLMPVFGWTQDSTATEKNFKFVPLLTSTPLLGVGYGGAVSFLYRADEESSKSQLSLSGQYSNTSSYVIAADNKLFFKENKIRSNTFTSYSDINNEFSSTGIDVSYNVRTLALLERIVFAVATKSFLGGQVSYKQFRYKPNNEAGEEFLFENGIVEEKTAGLGVVYSYDSRANKYFPRDAWFIDVILNANPDWLGAVNTYYNLSTNARYYAKGFRSKDVWAWQFYGEYASKNATDNGLPTLSGKSLLRGFPAGQFKARYMSGAQTEYRYQIKNSRFRLISFVGLANLAGGSIGDEEQSRQDDGWYSAGGLGARYAIQQKTGVDLRLDFVLTSEGDKAVYLKLNQAF